MAILYYKSDFMAETGVKPRLVRLVSNDDYDTITTEGYLTSSLLSANPLEPTDFIFVTYGDDANTHGIFYPTFSSGVVTLVSFMGEMSVELPVTTGHIAAFVDESGQIGDDPATAINGGNLQAGLSGTAGYLASFPATSSKGSLRVTAVANTGDTITTISNAAMGQASVISIPDPATATANFAVAPAALVNNNLVKASGTAGLVADTGIAASNVQLASLLHGVASSVWGGGGTSHAFTITGMPATAIAIPAIIAQAGTAYIVSYAVTLNTLTVTFSADPGAGTQLHVIYLNVAQ